VLGAAVVNALSSIRIDERVPKILTSIDPYGQRRAHSAANSYPASKATRPVPAAAWTPSAGRTSGTADADQRLALNESAGVSRC
jgi:hypothetical protein